VNASRLNPSQASKYSIYLPLMEGWKTELTGWLAGYIPRWFTSPLPADAVTKPPHVFTVFRLYHILLPISWHQAKLPEKSLMSSLCLWSVGCRETRFHVVSMESSYIYSTICVRLHCRQSGSSSIIDYVVCFRLIRNQSRRRTVSIDVLVITAIRRRRPCSRSRMFGVTQLG